MCKKNDINCSISFIPRKIHTLVGDVRSESGHGGEQHLVGDR